MRPQQGSLNLASVAAMVARTIASVTAPPYNADNTGSSYARAAMQRCIDDVHAAGGGPIRVPGGVYLLDDELITYSDIELIGDGPGRTIVRGDNLTNKSLIRNAVAATHSFAAADRRFRVAISGIEFDNQSDANVGCRGVDLRQTSFFILDNCTIRDCDIGVDVSNFTTQGLVSNLDIVNGAIGVKATNGTRAVEFNRIRTVNSDIGYEIDKGADDIVNNLTFICCEVSGFDVAAGRGFRFGETASGGGECDTMRMEGCRIEQAGGTGIKIGAFVSNWSEDATYFSSLGTNIEWLGNATQGRDPLSTKNGGMFPCLVRDSLNGTARGRLKFNGTNIMMMRSGTDSQYFNLWALDIIANGVASRLAAARLQLAAGTDWDGSEIVLGAGFGATATVAVVDANDSRGRIEITPGGAGIAANPSLTITWKDGAWISIGRPIVVRNDPNLPAGPTQLTWTKISNTGLQITFRDTPQAGEVIGIEYFVCG